MGFFKDSLKKWFYTNNSSAASSDARIPLLTSAGEPKGSDTMANLASVLGATNKNISIGTFASGETKTITNTIYKLLLISVNTNGIWIIVLCQQSEYSIVAKGARWDSFFNVAYSDSVLSLTSKESISSGVWYSIL